MIYFAKAGFGTHFDPATNNIKYVPLGTNAPDFAIVGLDTGTDRPGLDKSTYKVRREECDTFGALLKAKGYISKPFLADVQDEALYQRILRDFRESHPGHCDRLTYIYNAQKRFYEMMDAWKGGDIETLGRIFREDGVGLRDEYVIS
jgi:galactokinase